MVTFSVFGLEGHQLGKQENTENERKMEEKFQPQLCS